MFRFTFREVDYTAIFWYEPDRRAVEFTQCAFFDSDIYSNYKRGMYKKDLDLADIRLAWGGSVRNANDQHCRSTGRWYALARCLVDFGKDGDIITRGEWADIWKAYYACRTKRPAPTTDEWKEIWYWYYHKYASKRKGWYDDIIDLLDNAIENLNSIKFDKESE
jgi:hypothetical protein